MKEPQDRSAEVEAADCIIEVWHIDFCDCFEQDTTRLFSNRECWFCKYGDFGINTEHPTKTGICRLERHSSGKPRSDLYKKTEDKRI